MSSPSSAAGRWSTNRLLDAAPEATALSPASKAGPLQPTPRSRRALEGLQALLRHNAAGSTHPFCILRLLVVARAGIASSRPFLSFSGLFSKLFLPVVPTRGTAQHPPPPPTNPHRRVRMARFGSRGGGRGRCAVSSSNSRSSCWSLQAAPDLCGVSGQRSSQMAGGCGYRLACLGRGGGTPSRCDDASLRMAPSHASSKLTAPCLHPHRGLAATARRRRGKTSGVCARSSGAR